MAQDDHDLIKKAQSGDMTAFEQLVYQYDKRVLAITMSFTNDADESQDIYQEIFVRVYRALPKFQFRSQFSTWLYRIATNVCLTYQSRQKSRIMMSIDESMEDDEGNAFGIGNTLMDHIETDEYTINAEIAAHIGQALTTLSPQQRLVFTMRHFEGFKLREIAEIMACAEGTIKKYLFTATERMRDQLKDVFQ